MANETFNSGVDHFSLQSGTSNALKVVSSSENISKQSQSGPNNWEKAPARGCAGRSSTRR